MFTATEFRLIREKCLPDLQNLLAMLNIPEPNWDSGNEFKIYEKLDDEIVKRVCQFMKSESIIDGYTKLMTLGGLKFKYSETDNELLAKILQNKEKVMRGATQAVHSAQETITESQPQKIQKTIEKKVLLPGFIICGIVLIIAGIALSDFIGTIGAGIAAILGLISAALGFKGKIEKETVEIEGAPVQKKVVSETKIAPFTRTEIQQIFQVLIQIDTVIRAI